MPGSGPDLALLLLGGYRRLVDAAVVELAAQGFEDVRPSQDFAMRAIAAGATCASDLARSLAVTKQAAGYTIAALTERGWVVSEPDPTDARRKRVRITEQGHTYMRTGEEIFDGLRQRLEEDLGAEGLATLERLLRVVVGDAPVRLEAPGWVADALR